MPVATRRCFHHTPDDAIGYADVEEAVVHEYPPDRSKPISTARLRPGPDAALLEACWREHPDHLLIVDTDLTVRWSNRLPRDEAATAARELPEWLDGTALRIATEMVRACLSPTRSTPDATTRECDDGDRFATIRVRPCERGRHHEAAAFVCITDTTAQRRAERERTRLQAEARHRQQAEMLGTLVTGVAHEINNPVQAIVSCGELLLADRSASAKARELAADARDEAHRIAKVIRDLMEFARPQPEELRAEAPSAIIERALVWTRMLLRRDIIDLRVQIEPDLPLVRCRPREIQTVLLHLVTNAREALRMIGRNGDAPTVTLGARLGDSPDTICLVVQDDGPGIPRAHIDKIFDPFYTTKPHNQGAGLGLHLARELVTSLGGRITVHSAPGVATRFGVELPAIVAAAGTD